MEDLKKLGANQDIVVCKPDKGRGVVILDKIPYIDKMLLLISDRSKFEPIYESIQKFTLKIEDKVNYFLRKLKNSDVISAETCSKLLASGSSPGILYGLPKIHKPDFISNFQFRPIFAAYNCPTYKIAKYLVPLLNPLSNSEFTVENSYEFVSQISNFSYKNSYFMTSFDVSNLFTNIPLTETIDIILNSLFPNLNADFKGFSRQLFKKFLELAVTNSFFIFNNNLFKQTDGLGMGLPLAPTFANIFMSFHEQRWLEECPPQFAPLFYRRYVDDTFVIFKEEAHATSFFNFINSQHSNIRFTRENETNGQIPFLDVLVTADGNKLRSSVYRKPTNTGLSISFSVFVTTDSN